MKRWWHALEVMAAIAALTLGLFATFEAVSWIGKPFPGFLWAERLTVNQLAMLHDWPGYLHHLKPDEQLQKIDDQPVKVSRDLVERLATWHPGETHRFTFADHGTLAFRLRAFTLSDLVSIALMPLLAGLGYLLVGLGVRLARPASRDAALLFWFCLPASLFNFTIFDNATDHRLRLVWVMALALIPAGMAPMGTLFREKGRVPILRSLLRVFAVACGLLGIAYVSSAEHEALYVALWYAIQVVMLVGYAGGLFGLLRTRLGSREPLTLRQVELVLLGWLLSTGPSMIWTVGNLLGYELFPYPFGSAFFLLFPAYIAFAVLRHRLFDVSLALRRTLTYTVLILLLGGAYGLIFLSIEGLTGRHPLWVQVVLTAVIAVSFAPLRDAVRRRLNLYLFRTPYDFQAIVSRFGRMTRHTLDVDSVERVFRQELEEALRPGGIEIELSDQPHATQFLLRGAWSVPLSVGGDPIGRVILGPRANGMPYGPPDQALVHALCQQLSFTLRTAQLLERLHDQLDQQERYIQRLMESDDVIARLRQLDSLRKEAFDQASHDLRAPLASISLTCQSLLKGHLGPVPETVAQEVRVVLGNTQALGSLIDGILDSARHEAHKLVLDLKPVALEPIAREVVALVAPLAEASDTRLTVDDTLAAMPPVMADARRLRQVLLNLLSNAVKFTSDGEVHLGATFTGDRVRIRVSDTGAGMSPEQLERLFERFSPSTGSHTGLAGSGLGLSLVKAISELHGAEIEVHSTLGQGTTVEVAWPVSGEQPTHRGEHLVEIDGLGEKRAGS